MTLRGKIIDTNNFKTDIISDAIEDYQIGFEDTRDGKGELSNTKELSHEKWTQWEYSTYNYFTSRKNSRGVTLFYVIRKDTPSTEDSKERDVKIIYQASLFGNMFPETQGKFLIFSRN